jgi:hypothetical protein
MKDNMASKATRREDTLRFEKLTLFILALCLFALVGLHVFRLF